MKKILSIFLIIPMLLWGQKPKDRFTVYEKQYIARSDSFLVGKLSRQNFEKYLKFSNVYHYIQNDNLLTFPNDITNPNVTHIITSYTLTIPELNIEYSTDLVFDRRINCYYFKDSADIPSYILNNTTRDLLDTGEIKAILIKQGAESYNINLGQCSYNDSLKTYVYYANEIVKPYNNETLQETINQYKINAKNGKIYSIDKNVVISYKPRGHWFYYLDNIKEYQRGTPLDSIFSFDSISKISIIIDNQEINLNKRKRDKIISILKKAIKADGLEIKPTGNLIKLTFEGQNKPTLNYIYFSIGKIHFDTGIDYWGNKFNGTFFLPNNFDIEKFIKTARQ